MKSCIVIEELARLEQRRQLKKGKFVSLFNTSTVHNLDSEEKKEFFNYLKRKKRPVRLLASFFLLMAIGFFVVKTKVTGLTVVEDPTINSGLSVIFAGLAVASILLGFFLFRRDKEIRRKFKEHIEIAEKRLH